MTNISEALVLRMNWKRSTKAILTFKQKCIESERYLPAWFMYDEIRIDIAFYLKVVLEYSEFFEKSMQNLYRENANEFSRTEKSYLHL